MKRSFPDVPLYVLLVVTLLPAFAAPPKDAIIWEAEQVSSVRDDGFIIENVPWDPAGKISGGRALSCPMPVPGEQATLGEVTYRLNIPRSDTYYLWMRTRWTMVLDPVTDHGRFSNTVTVGLMDEPNVPAGRETQLRWLFGGDTTYNVFHWICLLDNTMRVQKLSLRKGFITLYCETRHAGIKIDQCLLTTDPVYRPNGCLTPTVGNSSPAFLPLRDDDVLLLIRQAGDGKQAAIQQLTTMGMARVLPVLAYALKYDKYFAGVFQTIRRLHITDGRLSPFLAACLDATKTMIFDETVTASQQNITGNERLMQILILAKQIPSQRYLGSIIEKARKDNTISTAGVPRSVLGCAAEALFVITKGEIGIADYTSADVQNEATTREAILRSWEQWWAAERVGDMHALAKQGDIERMKAVLAICPALVNIREDGESPLLYTIRGKQLAAVRFQVEQGADVTLTAANGTSAL
ncbi:MAG: hypothetical protein BWY25_01475 [Chloroflexi bacterium ADurb.Bin222]|nr:MAG: hypothetical protein BWY25_01475 [Chloroflexi bacterium ADurb.Bin222]